MLNAFSHFVYSVCCRDTNEITIKEKSQIQRHNRSWHGVALLMSLLFVFFLFVVSQFYVASLDFRKLNFLLCVTHTHTHCVCVRKMNFLRIKWNFMRFLGPDSFQFIWSANKIPFQWMTTYTLKTITICIIFSFKKNSVAILDVHNLNEIIFCCVSSHFAECFVRNSFPNDNNVLLRTFIHTIKWAIFSCINKLEQHSHLHCVCA